ncbi:RNA polymerase sigma factor SigJ [Actinacidiphila rubida]|uniref:RNA polymerase, sigma subunit, ECF family n=1 Tax=Actinacidiphila rubida TaxID=310780 RepID=A0A1H8KZ83_9ACTN|nr:RNA polymerase sigma factor SigJ [Actinacidiphila rubida]SEN98222.1 RNA polymerase, sigma subunit, ECF family [Actinacidiphila rubida]
MTAPVGTDGERGAAGERRHLTAVAYRLLGSLTEAEDVVQETYARWYALTARQRGDIEVPAAWLTTVAGRICLDLLRSARVRRERYVGAWLPEPLPGGERGDGPPEDAGDPAERVALDESVHMAFLVLLEEVTPAERVAFVLHDVFRYSFVEIAGVVGRTPAACRQLASSARRRVRGAQPGAAAAGAGSATEQASLVREFQQAWQAKDIAALVGLLDPGAVMVTDGGGLAQAAARPVEGGEPIARYLAHFAARAPGLDLSVRTVNGRPGLVARHAGTTVSVAAFAFTGDGGTARISRIWTVRNPDKLRAW